MEASADGAADADAKRLLKGLLVELVCKSTAGKC
jgi:hypothetical protein